MKIDLEAIESTARKAQEGGTQFVGFDGMDSYDEFCAKCSPDVVLALVRVAKAAVRAAADIRSDTPDGGASQYALLMAVDALEDT